MNSRLERLLSQDAPLVPAVCCRRTPEESQASPGVAWRAETGPERVGTYWRTDNAKNPGADAVAGM